MKNHLRLSLRFVPAAAVLAALTAFWQVYVKVTGMNSVILPAPTQVASTTWSHVGLLLSDMSVTLQAIILGFLLGVLIGMICGILIFESKVIDQALYPIVIASQAIPLFTLAPLLIIWFGFDLTPKVVMAALIVFFPICVNQVNGLRAADPGAVALLRSYGASERRIFRTVRFPTSVPLLLAGMQLGVTYAVIGAVLAEWLGANRGLGYRMVVANALSQTDLVFGAILVTALLSIVLFVLVRVIGDLVFPWQRLPKERPR